jgi:NtrC-family two-component system sensor histidine kinase KinB
MTLRTRLLLGYGYLVALLLLAAGSAMIAFFHLSVGVEEAVEKNFQSMRAAMTMMEALERQDSATLAALIEGRPDAGEMAGHEQAFLEALATAQGNVTEPEEAEILAAVAEDFEAYQLARNRLIANRPERPLAAYNERVFPRFSAAKAGVLRLLAVNQQAMLRAEREARETAIQSGTWLGFLVVIAIVSLVFLSRVMQHQILSRLERLSSGIEAMTVGHRRRLREEGDDELAVIARQVNRLLDQYDELKGTSQGRLAQERRLVLGLLRSLDGRAALFGPSGELLAGEIEPGGLEHGIVSWIRGEGRERAEPAEPVRATVSADGREAELELVLAPGKRPVGWLARLRGPGV